MNRSLAFLNSAIESASCDCIEWPFGRDKAGYARAFVSGYTTRLAHRIMCEMAHGAPPFKGAMARHLCGNGHKGCVNPSHIAWGTAIDNARDKISHGTQARGEATRKSKLTADSVRAIRALRSNGCTQMGIAAKIGVHHTTVQAVLDGRTWRHIQ